MLRSTDDTRTVIGPRGTVLDPFPGGTERYRIHEEEIPRAGAIVRRNWQYTRWTDGTPYLWIGRRKTTGRGEGSSGLQFDALEGS